ncbi:MAG: DUF2934 domain-containing protein [Vicinamibacterales bacterium]
MAKRRKTPDVHDVAAESAAIYPDTSAGPPTPEQIAAEAHAIYRERGSGHGRELDDWLEAERRLSQRPPADRDRSGS